MRDMTPEEVLRGRYPAESAVDRMANSQTAIYGIVRVHADLAAAAVVEVSTAAAAAERERLIGLLRDGSIGDGSLLARRVLDAVADELSRAGEGNTGA